MKSDIVEIKVGLIHQTPNAWLVDDGDVEVWIPKSQGELDLNADNKTYTLICRQKLAEEKGLV